MSRVAGEPVSIPENRSSFDSPAETAGGNKWSVDGRLFSGVIGDPVDGEVAPGGSKASAADFDGIVDAAFGRGSAAPGGSGWRVVGSEVGLVSGTEGLVDATGSGGSSGGAVGVDGEPATGGAGESGT